MCLPGHPKGKRAWGTYKQWRCTSSVVFEKFSFSLESATVSYLRSLQFAIFGRRLLPFLVVAVWLFFSLLEVFSSQTAIIFQTCFMLSLSDASSLSFLEQNVMIYIYIYIYIWNFLKHGTESHMVMIWECQAWFFFPLRVFFKKRTFFSGQWTPCRNIKENVYWIKVIFFPTTSLPAVVFMIRGRRSRHLRVLTKRQIFNRIHPNWMTLNRQPEGSWWDRLGKGVGEARLWCLVHPPAKLCHRLSSCQAAGCPEAP